MKPKVLLIDGDQTTLQVLSSALRRDGDEVIFCKNPNEIQGALSRSDLGLVVADPTFAGSSFFEFLRRAKKSQPHLKVIFLSHPDHMASFQEKTFDNLDLGIFGVFKKPVSEEELTQAARKCLNEVQRWQQNQEMIAQLRVRLRRVEVGSEPMLWRSSGSSAMAGLNERLTILRKEGMRADVSESPVLIYGAEGTEKSSLARWIHSSSRRANGPWLSFDARSPQGSSAETELFGQEAGADGGVQQGLVELAQGGTLFINEISYLSSQVQSKLYQLIHDHKFLRVGGSDPVNANVRIIAASSFDVRSLSEKGEFDQKLYHEIARSEITIPALSQRSEDIPSLAQNFAREIFQSCGKTFPGFSQDALQFLRGYQWPGNTRELYRVLERVALIWKGNSEIQPSVFSLKPAVEGGRIESVANPFHSPSDSGVEGYMSLKKKWSDNFERQYLENALKRNAGNVSAAAREAKIDRSNFLRLLRRHQLKASPFRKAA